VLGVSSAAASDAESDPSKEGVPVVLGVSSAAASDPESDPGKESLSVVLGVSSAAASDPESDPGKEGMSGVGDGISVGSSSLQPVGSVQSVLPSLPFLLEESNGAFGSHMHLVPSTLGIWFGGHSHSPVTALEAEPSKVVSQSTQFFGSLIHP